MPAEEKPSAEQPAPEMSTEAPKNPAQVKSEELALVVPGAPEPPAPFSGEENPPQTPIPEEVQQLLDAPEEATFDAFKKLALTFPQAAVRQAATYCLKRISSGEPDAEELLIYRALIKDPDPKVRATATELIRSGALFQNWDVSSAVGELVLVLREKDAARYAFQAIATAGPKAEATVPILNSLVADDEYEFRDEAMETLGEIGPAARPAILNLHKRMVDDWSHYAADALGMIGAEATLVAETKNENSYIRGNAIRGLGKIREKSPLVIQTILAAAKDESAGVRSNAIEILAAIKPASPEVVAAIIQLANDDDVSVRSDAYSALPNIEPTMPEVLSTLTSALDSEKDQYIKDRIKSALSKLKGSTELRLNLLLGLAIENGGDTRESLNAGAEEFYPLLKAMAVDPKIPQQRREMALLGLVDIHYRLDIPLAQHHQETLEVSKPLIADDQPLPIRSAAALLYDLVSNDDEETLAINQQCILGEGLIEVRKRSVEQLCNYEYEPALPALIKLLEQGEPELKDVVLRKIYRFGEVATDAVPAIARMTLENVDENTYENFTIAQARALGKIGTHPDLSLPLLQKRLSELKPDDYAYEDILLALTEVIAANDLDATKVLPRIVNLVKDKDVYIRRHGMELLKILGPKAASTRGLVVKSLTSEDSGERSTAAETLGSFGPAAKDQAPLLVEAAKTWEEPYAPLRALAQIKAGGPQLAAATPKLIENLDIRVALLEALAAIGPEAKDAIPEVIKVLDSPDWEERYAAANMLGAMKESAKDALPKLKQLAIDDEDYDVHQAALDALRQIAPDDPAVMEAVFASIDIDDDEACREFITNQGDKAATFLQQAVESETPEVRKKALQLLGKVEIPRAQQLAIYQKLLTDNDPTVKSTAAQQLIKAGDRSDAAISALVAGLKTDDPWQFENTIVLNNRQATPALIDLILSNKTSEECRETAYTLLRTEVSPQYQARFQKLREARQDSENKPQKVWAACALAYLNDQSPDNVKVLLAAAKSASPQQADAIRGLGTFYLQDLPMRSEVEQALIALMESEDGEIAQLAADVSMYDELLPESRQKVMQLLSNEQTFQLAANVISSRPEAYDLPPATIENLADRLDNSNEEEDDDETEVRISTIAPILWQAGPAGVKRIVDSILDGKLTGRMRLVALMSNEDRRYDSENETPLDNETQAELTRLLSHEDQAVASGAAVIMAVENAQGVKLGPTLTAGFEVDDYHVRGYLSEALGKRQEEAKQLVPVLIEKLKTIDEDLRGEVVDPLARLGKDSPEATAALLDAIKSEQNEYNLDQFGRSLGDLAFAKLSEQIDLEKDEAKKANILYAYQSALDSRQYSTAGIPTEEPAGLREAAKSDNLGVSLPAANALAYFDPKAPELIAPLMAEIEMGESLRDVVSIVRKIKESAAPAVPKLAEALHQPDSDKYSLLDMLGAIGPAAAPATEEIVEILKDDQFRYTATRTLEKIGPGAKNAAPALEAQLPGAENLGDLADALLAIKAPTETLVAEFQRRLADPYRKYDTMVILSHMKDIMPTTKIWTEALQSDDLELQTSAAFGIRMSKSLDPELISPLASCLKSDAVNLRFAALSAMIKSQPPEEKCLPILRASLKDPESEIRERAIEGISYFKAPSADMATDIIPLLDDESDQVRYYAAQVLGKIGPPAKPAINRLLKLSREATKWRKQVFETAIWKIDQQTAQKAGIQPPEEETKE